MPFHTRLLMYARSYLGRRGHVVVERSAPQRAGRTPSHGSRRRGDWHLPRPTIGRVRDHARARRSPAMGPSSRLRR